MFLSVIFFLGVFLFLGSPFSYAGSDNSEGSEEIIGNKGILELQFSAESAGLADSFEREKDISMQSFDDGADMIQDGIMKIVDVLTKFMGLFAFIYIFYTGLSIVINGGGDELKGAKDKLLWSIFALLASFLVEPLVRTVFFGGSGDGDGGGIEAGEIFYNTFSASEAAKIGVVQIQGFISYIETFVVLLALIMMIRSAVGMIFAHSEELKLEEQKKAILWTGVGFIVILLSEVLVYFGIYGDPMTGEGTNVGKVVSEVSGVMNYLLGFIASIAVAMIIYGGTKMIFSAGEDAKDGAMVIKNTIIGAVIISVAYVLVVTLIGGKVF